MKPFIAAALALCAATPAFASPDFTVDFEKNWSAATPLAGEVNGYYGGGTAGDGTSGRNLGVNFTGFEGLSNDASFTYYGNAPSSRGVAYTYTDASENVNTAVMNLATGIRTLTFYYSSMTAVTNAIRAYSGLNGTGTLLGSLDLAANVTSDTFDRFSLVNYSFGGVARSFDFTNTAYAVAFDDISGTVPEPESVVLLMIGAAAALCLRGRGRDAARSRSLAHA